MRTAKGNTISIAYHSDLSGDCIILKGDVSIPVPFSELEEMVTDIKISSQRDELIRLVESMPDEDLTRCINILQCYMEDKNGKKEK